LAILEKAMPGRKVLQPYGFLVPLAMKMGCAARHE
jgi:hypothetical protein